MREAITEATPDILGGYDDALSTVQAQQQAVMGMPGAEVSAEQQNAFGRRIGEQRANLNEDLAQQLVAAATSRVYSDRQARQSYKSDVGQIAQQLLGVQDQAGLFASTRLGDLRDDRRKDRLARRGQDITASNNAASQTQSERNSIRSSGIDPDTGQPIPGGKLDPKADKKDKKKWNTSEQHLKAQDKVAQAVESLKALDPDKSDRREAAPLLVGGAKHPSQQVYDPKTGKKVINPDGTPKMTPELVVPKTGGLLATAAADMYYDGHLSRRTEQLLRRNKFNLRRLGFKTYEQWKREGGTDKPKPQKPANPLAGIKISGTTKVR